MTAPISSITVDPPPEQLGRLEKLQKHVERFSARHPIIAAITGIALTALSFVAFFVPGATMAATVGLIIGGAILSYVGQELVQIASREGIHHLFDKVIRPCRSKPPGPCPLPRRYEERTVRLEGSEAILAQLAYRKSTEGVDQPLLTLDESDGGKQGFLQGFLLAPQIDTLFNRLYRGQIAEANRRLSKDPSLQGRAKEWRLPPQYEAELEGMAEGLKAYEQQTGHSLGHIDVEALKAANIAQEILREPCQSSKTVVEQTEKGPYVVHLESRRSHALLAKYALIRRHTVTNYATGERREVEFVTYPGLVGSSAAINRTDGLMVAGKARTEVAGGVGASMLPRLLAESAANCEEAANLLAQLHKMAPLQQTDEIVVADGQSALRLSIPVDDEEGIAVSDVEFVSDAVEAARQCGGLHTTLVAAKRAGEEASWLWDNYHAERRLS